MYVFMPKIYCFKDHSMEKRIIFSTDGNVTTVYPHIKNLDPPTSNHIQKVIKIDQTCKCKS